MTVEYVDAGEAINQGQLNYKTPGADVAPPAAEATGDEVHGGQSFISWRRYGRRRSTSLPRATTISSTRSRPKRP